MSQTPELTADLFSSLPPTRIQRSMSEPIRPASLDWEARWQGPDQGLIACWERGRERVREDAGLAAAAVAGQLPLLPWKGGFEKATKKGSRYGTLNYLAMWQGLRGQDLDIDTTADVEITCSATGMRTVFTADAAKYAEE